MSNNFNTMPPPPIGMGHNQVGYDSYGNPVQMQTYPPQYYQQQMPQYQPMPQYQQAPQYQQPPTMQPVSGGIGASFKNLIGTNVTIPIISDNSTANVVPAEKTKRKRKSKDGSETEETSLVKQDPASVVEDVSYAETYEYTNQLIRGTISQVDELSSDLKYELDKIRSASPTQIKGKYTYLANISSAMTGLLGTKITAIRELNSSIKAVNDAEYKRYKDLRAADSGDDNAAIMNLYNAYVQAPRGSLPNGIQYTQPNTLDITSGLNGIVRVDAATPAARDAGFQGFMSNLTPEQNMMINESNPYIEEVIVYDQSTGRKYFEWRNLQTGERVPNMPLTDQLLMEDFVIDPRNRTAKNINIHSSMKVIYENEGAFNEY